MTTSYRPTDHELRESVAEELGWLPSVQADRVGVSVNEGAVTLSGQVDTYPEKTAAVQAAFRVRGVNAVADEINVHNDFTPARDTDITRAVNHALTYTVPAPSGSVKADVRDHVVTLTGQVDWNFQREAITKAMAAIRGVVEVQNDVALVPREPLSPSVAVSNITAALLRNARIDAQHIHVTVTGTTVTLTGAVSSWSEHRQAAHAAWATPGVATVENLLTVSF